MKKPKDPWKKILHGDIGFFISLIFSFPILLGFGGFYISLGAEKSFEFLWQVILFCFIAGTLITTMSPKGLSSDQIEYFPRLGFLFIIIGIFLLISAGISSFFLFGNETIGYVGIFCIGCSFLILSLFLSNLMLELISRIISLK